MAWETLDTRRQHERGNRVLLGKKQPKGGRNIITTSEYFFWRKCFGKLRVMKEKKRERQAGLCTLTDREVVGARDKVRAEDMTYEMRIFVYVSVIT
jgi:hypothetical protein